jgi:hypothetical protein
LCWFSFAVDPLRALTVNTLHPVSVLHNAGLGHTWSSWSSVTTIARLSDESEAGAEFIVFGADADRLNIVSGGTSETLRASVEYPGKARVPCPVFRGIARTLRFQRGKVIMISFSPGSLRIDQTDYRHPNISVLALDGEKAIIGTKPAKPQPLVSTAAVASGLLNIHPQPVAPYISG